MNLHLPEKVFLTLETATFGLVKTHMKKNSTVMNTNFQLMFGRLFWQINNVIGPSIFPNRLNVTVYLVFLRGVLPELLEDVPLGNRLRISFQHNSAPAYFSNIACYRLDHRKQWKSTDLAHFNIKTTF